MELNETREVVPGPQQVAISGLLEFIKQHFPDMDVAVQMGRGGDAYLFGWSVDKGLHIMRRDKAAYAAAPVHLEVSADKGKVYITRTV